jgi:hypothetical protein
MDLWGSLTPPHPSHATASLAKRNLWENVFLKATSQAALNLR